MGIYDTNTLNRVVERIRPIPTFFLDTFFPEVMTSDKEEIYFDVVENKPRISPFVHPLQAGKVVEGTGYSTKSFKPAYIKDKRVHNPLKALKRKAGEALGGSMTNEQRLQAVLVSDLKDQKDMLIRRQEVMAAEAIIDGKQTVVGDGINAIVDYGRDAALNVVLTSTAKWDDAGNTSQSNSFEDWSELLLQKSGSGAGIAVMDTKAWKLLKKDANLTKLLDRMYKGGDGTKVDMQPRFAVEGASYKGNIGDIEIWVYSHPYTDVDGTAKNIMPDNTVILASRTNVQGVRHFGAIMDIKAGLVPMEQFVKSWEEEDPSVRYLLSQSAPLMVPYRTNATLKAKVA